MLKYSIIIITLLVAILGNCAPPKTLEQNRTTSQKPDKTEFVFPDDWMGYWKGELEVYKQNKLVRSLPMALDHSYTDTTGYYTWAIIYGQDSIAGRRDYYLKTVNEEKGHYQTDERNSIFLDSYLYGNKLVAYYDVGSIIIQSSYTREGEEMHFEILALDSEPISITGNKIVNGDTIPEVKSYPINTMQKAILKKVR